MNKKIKLIILIILGLALLFGSAKNFVSKDEDNKEKVEAQNEIVGEYTPLEEITEEQNRQTTIRLYFVNKQTRELTQETKRIDSKNLLKEPYKYLIELLIAGSENTELESSIPKGTKVLGAELKGDILNLNLSKEFIENHIGSKEEEQLTIDSIVKTLTQLNEIEHVKILIEGDENAEFKDKQINFKNKF